MNNRPMKICLVKHLMQLSYIIDLYFAKHAEQTIAFSIINPIHLQQSFKTCTIPRQFSWESWSINPMIVMIKLQRSPLGGESVYSLFHYVVMIKNWITCDSGAPDEWAMKVMQTWKKLFFNCANPAKLIGVRLNLEVTITWKYLPFCVRKNSSANYNVPSYSLLRWFTNLADSQPIRVIMHW